MFMTFFCEIKNINSCKVIKCKFYTYLVLLLIAVVYQLKMPSLSIARNSLKSFDFRRLENLKKIIMVISYEIST